MRPSGHHYRFSRYRFPRGAMRLAQPPIDIAFVAVIVLVSAAGTPPTVGPSAALPPGAHGTVAVAHDAGTISKAIGPTSPSAVRCLAKGELDCTGNPAVHNPSVSPVAFWTNLSSSIRAQPEAPSEQAVHDGTMVYDARDGYFLFCSPDSPATFNTTTWIFNRGVWSWVPTSPQPPIVFGASMVYDAADGYVLWVGASNWFWQGSTWSFQGGHWTNRTVTSDQPPRRSGAGIAYDVAAGTVVLFGGFRNYPDRGLNDTWTYSGGSWTNVTNASRPQPPEVYGTAMAYDSFSKSVVMFSGGPWSGSPLFAYWWTFSNGQWVNQTNLSQAHPVPRASAGFSAGAIDESAALVGGSDSVGIPFLNDTWTYSNDSWTNVSDQVGGVALPHFPVDAFAYDSADNFSLLLMEGNTGGNPGPIDAYALGPSVITFPSLSRSILDLGQSFNLSVSTFPPGQNLSFRDLPVGCSSPSPGNLSCTPSTVGPFRVNISANSSIGPAAVSSVTVEVDPDPAIASFAALPANLTLGNSTTLAVTPAFGTPPYAFLYSGLPSGCLSANRSSLTCSPALAGGFQVSVLLTDSLGVSANASISLVVNPRPVGLSLQLTPSLLDLGHSASLFFNTTGGTPPLRFAYTGLPNGCESPDSPTLSCAPAVTGTFTVSASATDTFGWSATLSAVLTVFPALASPSLTLDRNSSEVGRASLIHAVGSGGDPPYRYLLQGFPGPCSLAALPASCFPNASGVFHLTLSVTDALGTSAVSKVSVLDVAPALTVSSFLFDPDRVENGSSSAALAVPSGGVPPYSVEFASSTGTALPCAVQGDRLTCTPSNPGTLAASVAVTDSLGVSVHALAELTVLPSLSILAFSASPAPVSPGSPVALRLSLSGGAPPYSVTYLGLPAGCASANVTNLTCRPSASGSFTVEAVVVDDLGGEARQNLSLVVEWNVLGVPIVYVAASGGAVVIAAVAVVVVRRRRKSGNAPPEPDASVDSDTTPP
jgi:hypothetical protein